MQGLTISNSSFAVCNWTLDGTLAAPRIGTSGIWRVVALVRCIYVVQCAWCCHRLLLIEYYCTYKRYVQQGTATLDRLWLRARLQRTIPRRIIVHRVQSSVFRKSICGSWVLVRIYLQRQTHVRRAPQHRDMPEAGGPRCQ